MNITGNLFPQWLLPEMKDHLPGTVTVSFKYLPGGIVEKSFATEDVFERKAKYWLYYIYWQALVLYALGSDNVPFLWKEFN